MNTTQKELEVCSLLSSSLNIPKPTPGDIVGRGFADVGYMDYLLSSNDNLYCFESATLIKISNDELERLFLVPTFSNSVDLFERKTDSYVKEIKRIGSSSWSLIFEDSNQTLNDTFVGKTPREAVLLALAVIKKIYSNDGASRKLRTT